MPLTVIKYGSSVLRSPDDIPIVAEDIADRASEGRHIVAVVSAFEGRTAQLIGAAESRALPDDSVAYAEFLAAGEYESAVALLRVLQGLAIEASIATARRIGFVATGPRTDANPVLLDQNAVVEILKTTPVLIVPGFSAVDADGDAVLLGRGGSDLTAVHIAARLNLPSVRLVKDVDAVYDRDPNAGPGARRLLKIDHETALQVGGKLIQPKALRYARSAGVAIEISALGQHAPGTLICSAF